MITIHGILTFDTMEKTRARLDERDIADAVYDEKAQAIAEPALKSKVDEHCEHAARCDRDGRNDGPSLSVRPGVVTGDNTSGPPGTIAWQSRRSPDPDEVPGGLGHIGTGLSPTMTTARHVRRNMVPPRGEFIEDEAQCHGL